MIGASDEAVSEALLSLADVPTVPGSGQQTQQSKTQPRSAKGALAQQAVDMESRVTESSDTNSRKRRREQNRLAAQECRRRKREYVSQLEQRKYRRARACRLRTG